MNRRCGALLILAIICLVAYVTPHVTRTYNGIVVPTTTPSRKVPSFENLSAEEQARIKEKRDAMERLRPFHYHMDHARKDKSI